jgi:hypothetical protein
MAVKIREKNGKWWLLVGAALLSSTGCVVPRPRPEPPALVTRAELPPHVIEIAEDLLSCERGYLIRQGRCIPFEEIPHGPVVEISSLASAGEGAGGGRLCPSGGCGSLVAPSYSSLVYSSVSPYDYWPAGLYCGGHGGRPCVPHVRGFRGARLAFGGRFGSFVQERRLGAWSSGFLGAPLRLHSSAAQRSQPGGRFGHNRTSRRR